MKKRWSKGRSYILIGILGILLAGCGAKRYDVREITCLSKNDCQEPEWCKKIPDSSKEVKYFCGVSEKITSEREGRNEAMEHARLQVIDFLGVYLKKEIRVATAKIGLSSDILDPTHATEKEKRELSGGVAKYVKDKEWQVNRFYDKKRALEYVVVYVLAEFPLNDETKNAGIDTLERYAEMQKRKKEITEEQFRRVKELLDKMRKQ